MAKKKDGLSKAQYSALSGIAHHVTNKHSHLRWYMDVSNTHPFLEYKRQEFHRLTAIKESVTRLYSWQGEGIGVMSLMDLMQLGLVEKKIGTGAFRLTEKGWIEVREKMESEKLEVREDGDSRTRCEICGDVDRHMSAVKFWRSVGREFYLCNDCGKDMDSSQVLEILIGIQSIDLAEDERPVWQMY